MFVCVYDNAYFIPYIHIRYSKYVIHIYVYRKILYELVLEILPSMYIEKLVHIIHVYQQYHGGVGCIKPAQSSD